MKQFEDLNIIIKDLMGEFLRAGHVIHMATDWITDMEEKLEIVTVKTGEKDGD